ncbi:MAG: UMP kinase [Thermoplasmataceae archaeon]|jgi:uridylate kinase|nr:UMP kinase [Candidatus Thermoplasmatota archaeon]
MKSIVISLGGSIISGDRLDIVFMKQFSKMMEQSKAFGKVGIVVGGGRLARNYISDLRETGTNDIILDEIGINATRMNALAMTTFFENSNLKIPTNINDAAELSNNYRFTIMGGTEAGHTTDTVAALLAERLGSTVLINATSVDGVYTDDPRTNRNAEKIGRMSYDDAIALSLKKSIGAGPNVFMDLTSLHIAKRSKIRIFVIDGRKLEDYENIVQHEACSGTVIQ